MIHSMELLGRVVLLDGLNNEVGFQIGQKDGEILYIDAAKDVIQELSQHYLGDPIVITVYSQWRKAQKKSGNIFDPSEWERTEFKVTTIKDRGDE